MSFAAPVPPEEVRRRLDRGFPWHGRGRPVRCRVRRSGLLKVGPIGVLEDRPQAYLAVLPDGDGATVNGVVRAGWAARFVWGMWVVLLLPLAVAAAVDRLRVALDGGSAGAWLRALLAVFVIYAFFELLLANRRGKAILRDRLIETVTAPG